MEGKHKRLNSPHTKLVLSVYLSVLDASHRFCIGLYPVSIYCIYLDLKQGLNAIALDVLTEKGQMPQVH